MPETFPRQFARTRRFTLGEPRAFTICDDGRRVLFLRSLSGEDARTGLWRLDLPDGEETLVVDPSVGLEDDSLTPEERARRERVRETASGVVAFAADDAGTRAVYVAGGAVRCVDVETGETRPLPAGPGAYDPRLDPTGARVAYVAGRELRVVEVDGGDDRVLAAEAADTVSWGRAEFVAAEEMDRTRGFWWAPDGSSLLAARVDETAVAQWWIADPAHPDRPPTAVRYPAAGEANADVSLHLLRLDDDTVAIEWDRSAFPYLARVVWAAGHPPVLQVQSRDQRTTRFLTVDTDTGATTVVVEDCDEVWVELFPGVPAWCGDELVRIADVGDTRRLYVGGKAVSPEHLYVRSVAGSGAGAVVFTASAGDPTRTHVFRWTPAGVEQVTTADGVHAATHSGDVTVVSGATLDRDGLEHHVITGTAVVPVRSHVAHPALTPAVRLLSLGPRGLRAGLLLPRDHTPGTKLPVLLDPYGGPHAQRVVASRRVWLEPQWWADQGFAVLVVDGRGTPGRGPAWERAVHHDLATPVLEDQVDALLAAADEEPALDLSRVAIRGWSFGGYLSALAVLRRPDVFHAAIAGAPVVDMALYDTHYTERYLGTPQDCPRSTGTTRCSMTRPRSRGRCC